MPYLSDIHDIDELQEGTVVKVFVDDLETESMLFLEKTVQSVRTTYEAKFGKKLSILSKKINLEENFGVVTLGANPYKN